LQPMFDKEFVQNIRWAVVLICLGTVVLTGPAITSSAGEATDTEGGPVISLDVKEKPLDEVLEIVSEVSGYEIILEGAWEDLTVSVKLEKATLEETLRRALRNVNHTAVWDEAEKTISLFVFDESGVSDKKQVRKQPAGKVRPPWPSSGRKREGGSVNATQPGDSRSRVLQPRIRPGSRRNIFDSNSGNFEQEQIPEITVSGEGTAFLQGSPTTGE
jgi:hypothetical protein